MDEELNFSGDAYEPDLDDRTLLESAPPPNSGLSFFAPPTDAPLALSDLDEWARRSAERRLEEAETACALGAMAPSQRIYCLKMIETNGDRRASRKAAGYGAGYDPERSDAVREFLLATALDNVRSARLRAETIIGRSDELYHRALAEGDYRTAILANEQLARLMARAQQSKAKVTYVFSDAPRPEDQNALDAILAANSPPGETA